MAAAGRRGAQLVRCRWPAPRRGILSPQRRGLRRRGSGAYFDEIDRLEVGFQTDRSDFASARTASGVVLPDNESSLSYVARIVAFCRQPGIDLRIFITPSHAHQQEVEAATGAWPSLEREARSGTNASEDAARHPSLPSIPAYDFSGYSTVTEEPLPAAGTRDEMRYYWDSSHFKSLVGDFALELVLGDGSAPDRAQATWRNAHCG